MTEDQNKDNGEEKYGFGVNLPKEVIELTEEALVRLRKVPPSKVAELVDAAIDYLKANS